MDGDFDTISYSIFDTITPAVQERLERTESYRHFVTEQAKLGKLAAESWAATGKLNSREVLAQEKIVAELGAEVLDESKGMQFLHAEPSYADFQKEKRP